MQLYFRHMGVIFTPEACHHQHGPREMSLTNGCRFVRGLQRSRDSPSQLRCGVPGDLGGFQSTLDHKGELTSATQGVFSKTSVDISCEESSILRIRTSFVYSLFGSLLSEHLYLRPQDGPGCARPTPQLLQTGPEGAWWQQAQNHHPALDPGSAILAADPLSGTQ